MKTGFRVLVLLLGVALTVPLPAADQRSWRLMQDFFREIFEQP